MFDPPRYLPTLPGTIMYRHGLPDPLTMTTLLPRQRPISASLTQFHDNAWQGGWPDSFTVSVFFLWLLRSCQPCRPLSLGLPSPSVGLSDLLPSLCLSHPLSLPLSHSLLSHTLSTSLSNPLSLYLSLYLSLSLSLSLSFLRFSVSAGGPTHSKCASPSKERQPFRSNARVTTERAALIDRALAHLQRVVRCVACVVYLTKVRPVTTLCLLAPLTHNVHVHCRVCVNVCGSK